MSEVIEKILLILFGLFILWLFLSWAVPEFAIINEHRDKANEMEEQEEDDQENGLRGQVKNIKSVSSKNILSCNTLIQFVQESNALSHKYNAIYK